VPPISTTFLLIEAGAGRELLDQLAIDRRAREVEVGELLGERQLGNAHLVVDRSCLLGSDLGLEQRTDDLLDAVLAFAAHRDDLVVDRPHAGKLQLAHHVENFRELHGRPPWNLPAVHRSGHNRRGAAGRGQDAPADRSTPQHQCQSAGPGR
jgi:hypothetical protein